jgi:la-related protein 1
MYMMGPPPQSQGVGAGGLPQAATSQQASQAKDSILEAVKVQVEYYFSVQNLVKDMFLRAKMDENGWIPIGVIAAFNRVRALAPNPSMIAAALEGSALVEVSQNQESIRVRDSWQSWVLPEDRRDLSSKRPQSSPGSPGPAGGVPGGINMASMFPCTEVPDQMLDRLVLVGRIASGDLVKDSEALAITSEVAAMVNNGIAVLESQLRSQSESQGDTLPIVSNHFYPIAPMLSQQQPNQKDSSQMPLVAPSAFGSHIGWMFVNSGAQTSSPESVSEEVVKHSEIKDFGHPAYTYFKANNYVQVKYKEFRDCCMEKKKDADQSHPPEMYTLYQFWGLFLRDVFNTAMYEDFKQSALADHAKGLGFGVTCLFGLYHNRLLKEFRPGLLKDMEQLQQQLSGAATAAKSQ